MIADIMKINHWIVFVVITIAFCSCSEEFNNSNYIVDLKRQTVTINAPSTVPALESIQNIQVNVPEDCEWKITSAIPDWITPNVTTGIGSGSIKMQVASNDIVEERHADVRLYGKDKYGDWTRNFTIEQKGVDAFFVIEKSQIDSLPPQSADTSVVFRTNINDYKISTSDDWIKIVEKGGVLSISVAENLTPAGRVGKISINGSRINETSLTISQKPYSISVSTTEQIFYRYKSASFKIHVTSDEQIEVKTPSWIEVQDNINVEDNSITFNLSENNTGSDRTDEVVISLKKVPQITHVVKVTQYYNLSNGYEYIDLGLPSGILWSIQNIGAISEEEKGDESRISYSVSNGGLGAPRYYASTTCSWASPWQIPTVNDYKELLENCSHRTVRINNVKCHEYTSTINGNKIVFPECNHLTSEVTPVYLGAGITYYPYATAFDGSTIDSIYGVEGYIRAVIHSNK